MCCSALQCVAGRYSSLQCVAVGCGVGYILSDTIALTLSATCVALCCSVLQCVAVSCSGLQWVAVGDGE